MRKRCREFREPGQYYARLVLRAEAAYLYEDAYRICKHIGAGHGLLKGHAPMEREHNPEARAAA